VARAALQLDETGVNRSSFTLKLAELGMTGVGRARFKSPLAHQYDPGPDLGLYGIRGRSATAPRDHHLSSTAATASSSRSSRAAPDRLQESLRQVGHGKAGQLHCLRLADRRGTADRGDLITWIHQGAV
jgi:hypothetical protein